MRLSYRTETDSLYIHLSERPGVDVVEVAEGVVVDIGDDDAPVGMDIDANASKVVDLSQLEIEGLSVNLGLQSPEQSKTG